MPENLKSFHYDGSTQERPSLRRVPDRAPASAGVGLLPLTPLKNLPDQFAAAVPNSDSVYRRLRMLAIGYQFHPGARLQASALASQLGVSQTPVREALTQLSAEQLVMSIPGRGFFAKILDASEMKQLLAAGRQLVMAVVINPECEIGAGELEALGLRMAKSGGAKSGGPVRHANRIATFCDEIVALTANDVIGNMVNNVSERLHFLRTLHYEHHANIKRSTELLTAAGNRLAASDMPSAAEQLSRHFRFESESVQDLVPLGLARCVQFGSASNSITA